LKSCCVDSKEGDVTTILSQPPIVCSAFGALDGSEIRPKHQLMYIRSLIPVFVEIYTSQVA